MTILHLLSQNHLTGAEVYASHLAEVQLASGHKVFQASNGFFHPTKAEKIELVVETKSYFDFKKSVKYLKDLIQKHQIQVVHTHSRAAAKLAYRACHDLKIGVVSTVHGRQHLSFSKKWKNIYGTHQIAICENVKNQLTNEFKYNPHKIKIIRNGINTDLFFPKKINSAKNKSDVLKISIVGRTTGPKKIRTESAIQALTTVLKDKSINFEIHLIGANESELDRTHNVENLFFHEVKNIHQGIYSQFDLIIGSGRVCMEALMSGVPTIAFGEAKYLGLTTKDNFKEHIKSNFGDIDSLSFGTPNTSASQLENDIEAYYNITATQILELANLTKNHFGLKTVSDEVQKIYEASYFEAHHSKWIPILMYHKIPDSKINSPHKIFVTKNDFEKHLKFFKDLGFKTITFNDLKLFKNGTKPMSEFPKKPLILTFDDGYVDNLKNANPLLVKYDFKAQIFLLANNGIAHNYWDEKDIHLGDKITQKNDRKLWLDSNFEIGSHGINHKRITEMTSEQAFTELYESKKSLEKEFNQEVCVYAYTYGDTNDSCAKLAESAGYDFAVNTDTGGLQIFDNPFQIFRVNIFPDETLFSLWKKTSTWYRKYYYNKRKK